MLRANPLVLTAAPLAVRGALPHGKRVNSRIENMQNMHAFSLFCIFELSYIEPQQPYLPIA